MHNAIELVLSRLFRASWQAGVLILLVLLAQWLLRRRLAPRWRHAVWLLVVARLALPFTPASAWSCFNLAKTAPSGPTRRTAASAPLRPPDASTPNPVSAQAPIAARSGLPPVAALNPPTLPSATATVLPPRPRFDPLALMPWVWFAGVLALGSYVARQIARAKRHLRRAQPVIAASTLDLLDVCRQQMNVRTTVTLLETDAVLTPALFGVFRPCLLLPVGFTARFSVAELRFVFLHEFAHLKRRDVALNWLITALQILHWFNPLVWLAFARMRADRELACDALALETAGESARQAYGETILRLLDQFARPVAMPGLVGILEDKHQLRRRILAIAGFRQPRRWSALAGLLIVGLGVIGLTDANNRQTAKSSAGADHSDNYPVWTPKLTPQGFKERVWGTVLFRGRPVPHAQLRFTRKMPDGVVVPLGDFHVADDQGHFLLWAEPRADRLVVRNQQDRAEVDLHGFTNGHAILLQGPGTVEGTLERDGRPWSNQLLMLSRIWDPIVDDLGREVRTEQNGRFTFRDVPAGEWHIFGDYLARLKQAGKGTNTHLSSLWGRVTVREGQVARTDLLLTSTMGLFPWPEGLRAHFAALRAQAMTSTAPPIPAPTNSDGRLYGTVLFDGKPVPHASILLQGTGVNGPGAADENGRTFFYPTTNLQRVVFWHDEGGAIVDARNLTNEFRVELEKFGLVQGILRHHSKPWADQIVALTPLATEFPLELCRSVRPVKTDAEGRFTFSGVPPGTWRVGYYPVSSEQPLKDALGRPVGRPLTKEEAKHLDRALAEVAGWPVGGPGPIAGPNPVTVKSGQPTTTEFDVSGRTIIGRAVADDPGRRFVWRGTNSIYNLRTPLPAEPTAPFRTEAERVAWFQRCVEARAKMRVYPMAMAKDGTFSVADVPPGDYELVFEITGEPAAGPAPNGHHTIATYAHGITVPAAPPGAAEVPVDLGTLMVPLDRGLRIGDTAPAWAGKTLDGPMLKLSDFAGKTTLLVFWSMNPYSVPEIRTEPLKLQSLLDQYGTNLMRVVGMTLASQSDDIQAFVDEHKLRWPQVSFDNLAASRVWQAYDVQAGPVLILVGADGKVQARHWTIDGIRPAIDEVLRWGESEDGPVYSGKPLSVWADEVCALNHLSNVINTNHPEVRAVRAIGTNAIP